MSRRTSFGMGYTHSEMNRSLQATGASHILTRLASRSITGHKLPIQVHQDYGLEFHLLLTDDSCIRRGCYSEGAARQICTQIERQFEGLYSCVFNTRRVLTLEDKVEQCFRADPVPGLGRTLCECVVCTSSRVREIEQIYSWLAKNNQAALHHQRDICPCRSNRVEILD